VNDYPGVPFDFYGAPGTVGDAVVVRAESEAAGVKIKGDNI
jgi:hypothetical protein